MTRLLLLGGDGFVGSSFSKLQTSFDQITVVNRKNGANAKGALVVDDPNNLSSELFSNVDVVINCFGVAHKKESGNEALFYLVNRDLALNLALKAKAMGVRTFVQMSSISVYGNACDIHSTTPVQPTTHYGRSKAAADQGLLSMESGKFKVLLVRPPMLYGCGAPGNMARLINLVGKLRYLPFANANEKRESLCINNFVLQLEHAIIHNYHGVVLLRDIKAFSTRELVEIISNELSVERGLFCVPPKALAVLVPGYYKKLFGRLRIYEGINCDADRGMHPVDPERILRLMVRNSRLD
jgi:UDP-glucose 4-epimerase